MYIKYSLINLMCWLAVSSMAQGAADAVDVFERLKSLNNFGSVLYVAAHPDDENTRLITYFANHDQYRTTYISLTRGDGGQNLIGTELREDLGVLRTQELLAARRIDGGEQTFSRAIDFGYSKHPEETFRIWDHDKVLADLVWAIRKYRPQVLVTRFHPNSAGKTHGHHTASAQLAMEAMTLAGNSDAYPEQLKYVATWSPSRIFFNTSYWFYGGKDKFEAVDKSKFLTVDVGSYLPSQGYSVSEIAGKSRSQHRCQGFGTSQDRGEHLEYLEQLGGATPSTNDIMADIDITWSKYGAQGTKIDQKIKAIIDQFSISDIQAILPELVELKSLMLALPSDIDITQKVATLDRIIVDVTGTFVEFKTTLQGIQPGQTIPIITEVTLRTAAEIRLKQIDFGAEGYVKDASLTMNIPFMDTTSITIDESQSYSSPYWLQEQNSLGMFTVSDQLDIGKPENDPLLVGTAVFEIAGHKIEIQQPVIYETVTPDYGEIKEALVVLPKVTLSLSHEQMLFSADNEQTIEVTAHSKASLDKGGRITAVVPKGWAATPASVAWEAGTYPSATFEITAPDRDSRGVLSFEVTYEGNRYNQSLTTIAYSHIPTQYVLNPAEVEVIKATINYNPVKVGYLMGAGDLVPDALTALGMDVTMLSPEDILSQSLNKYDVIMTGIRAFNVLSEMDQLQPRLVAFAAAGGHLIIQYNTRHRVVVDQIGPYPLTLSRFRVTEEDAEVRLLKPAHPFFNTPNKLTSHDFDDWVQERGLYFPSDWDASYEALLSMNDTGETPKDGSLLTAKYEQGQVTYTGISFFRELPAAVTGAYRLLANIVSYSVGN